MNEHMQMGPALHLLVPERACFSVLMPDGCCQVLPGTDGETSTQGLDNLGSRMADYYRQGACLPQSAAWPVPRSGIMDAPTSVLACLHL